MRRNILRTAALALLLAAATVTPASAEEFHFPTRCKFVPQWNAWLCLLGNEDPQAPETPTLPA
jgi:hypothetical protein